MTFIESIKTVYSKFANFSDRASRSEYWWFALFNFAVSIIIMLVEGGGYSSVGDGAASIGYNPGPVGIVWSLINLIPGIAVSVRRLHDLDKSGWWLLISLIPLIGLIVLLVWFASRGTAGGNRFGDDPLRA